MQEREQEWKQLAAEIKCPFKSKPELCRKIEGIKRSEQFLGHSAIVIAAECNFCGEKATGWGQR